MRIPRPVFELKKEEIDLLIKYFSDKNMGYKEAAKKIGVTRPQLYFTIRGIRNCSRASYQKIQKFIKKIEKEKVNA